MTVTPDHALNRRSVKLDVSHDEFIRYEVRYAPANPLFSIIDISPDTSPNQPILGPSAPEVTPGCFRAEWPAQGQSVTIGQHSHVFGAVFAGSVRYRLDADIHRADGSVEPVKRCRWTSDNDGDTVPNKLKIEVV